MIFKQIGKQGAALKKAKGVIYRVVLGGSASSSISFGIYSHLDTVTRVLNNVPTNARIDIVMNWRVENSSNDWSTGSWNGNFESQLFNGAQVKNWEFLQSPDCTEENIIRNEESASFYDFKPAGVNDTANCFFTVSVKPAVVFICESNLWRCNVFIQLTGNFDADEIIIGNPAPLISITRIK